MILILKINNTLVYQKKFENKELEALLHGNSCQMRADLAESLGVDHTSFKMIESIKNDSKARTLGGIQVEAERCRTAPCHVWTSLIQQQKRKGFRSASWLLMKKGYTTKTLHIEDHGVSPVMHWHWQQSRISMVQSFCSTFGGISRV